MMSPHWGQNFAISGYTPLVHPEISDSMDKFIELSGHKET
jgi:hypothetical protein